MEKVNRGEWSPPPTESGFDAATGPVPTFQVEASEWLHRGRLRAGDAEGESRVCRSAYGVKKPKNPAQRLLRERLKGLEPSTFCMASRRSSQLSYSREEAEYNGGWERLGPSRRRPRVVARGRASRG